MQPTTLGDMIRVQRALLHVSQQHVAAQIGVTAATISRWESDHSRPSFRNLLELSAALDWTREQRLQAFELAGHGNVSAVIG